MLAFDRAVIQRDDGSAQELTVDEFLALPLPERVRLILLRSVSFFQATAPVSLSVALDSLRGIERTPTPG